jgi:hypothetical protein
VSTQIVLLLIVKERCLSQFVFGEDSLKRDAHSTLPSCRVNHFVAVLCEFFQTRLTLPHPDKASYQWRYTLMITVRFIWLAKQNPLKRARILQTNYLWSTLNFTFSLFLLSKAHKTVI